MALSHQPHSNLDIESVKVAYRRWAHFYDVVFGSLSSIARKRAIKEVNALHGKDVLEVGVGTGLALPFYTTDKNITGIDLSEDMLLQAKKRVKEKKLTNVKDLKVMNAEKTSFPDNHFDIAVGMFVASVVPNPAKLFQELKRVVKPGGDILFINHFQADGGMRLKIEENMSRISRILGWHPDFEMKRLLPQEDIERCQIKPMPPFKIFTLVSLKNNK